GRRRDAVPVRRHHALRGHGGTGPGAMRPALAARRVHRNPAGVPGGSPPRLRPEGHRLHGRAHEGVPRRRPVEVPPPPHGHVQVIRQGKSLRNPSPRAALRGKPTPGSTDMLEFLNPGYLAAGGALVSAPIIIHLINRMRFKRLRWAAMEFLLKAQKRNRRRLIIEQLLLLLLRCLLVALVGLLVSRLLERATAAEGGVTLAYTHIVLVDDTLSMNDQWRDKEDNNKQKNCLMVAKDFIANKIVHAMSRSSTNDRLILVPLSRVALEGDKFQPVVYTDLAFAEKRNELDNALRNLEATKLHIDMDKGLAAVKKIVKDLEEGRVIVHVFTDLRASDWAAPHGKKLQDDLKMLAAWKKIDTLAKLDELKIDELKVSLRDTAHPYRGSRPGIPVAHDNLAITDFRAATRVAGKDMPVLFTVTIANYGAREAEVNVDIYDNATGTAFLDIDFNPTMPVKISPGSSVSA